MVTNCHESTTRRGVSASQPSVHQRLTCVFSEQVPKYRGNDASVTQGMEKSYQQLSQHKMSYLVSRCAQLDDTWFGHLILSTLISQDWSLSTEESMSGHTPSIELDEKQKLVLLVTPPLTTHQTKTCAKLIMLHLLTMFGKLPPPKGCLWVFVPQEEIKIYLA